MLLNKEELNRKLMKAMIIAGVSDQLISKAVCLAPYQVNKARKEIQVGPFN